MELSVGGIAAPHSRGCRNNTDAPDAFGRTPGSRRSSPSFRHGPLPKRIGGPTVRPRTECNRRLRRHGADPPPPSLPRLTPHRTPVLGVPARITEAGRHSRRPPMSARAAPPPPSRRAQELPKPAGVSRLMLWPAAPVRRSIRRFDEKGSELRRPSGANAMPTVASGEGRWPGRRGLTRSAADSAGVEGMRRRCPHGGDGSARGCRRRPCVGRHLLRWPMSGLPQPLRSGGATTGRRGRIHPARPGRAGRGGSGLRLAFGSVAPDHLGDAGGELRVGSGGGGDVVVLLDGESLATDRFDHLLRRLLAHLGRLFR